MNWSNIRHRCHIGVNEKVKKGGNYLIIFILIFSFTSKQSYSQQGIFFEDPPAITLPAIALSPLSPSTSGEVIATAEPAEEEEKSKPVLQGTIVESGARDTLKNVAVEVFFIDQEGQMQRAYTGLVHSGKFTIPLLPEATHLLILRKAGYESEAFLVEEEQALCEQAFELTAREKASHQEEQVTEDADSSGRESVILVSADMDDVLDLSKFRTESGQLLAILVPQSQAERLEIKEELSEKGGVDSLAKEERQEIAGAPIGRYVLTAATSFRQKATHESDVLLRFQPNDEVEVLEKTNVWWWRVRYNDRTGYVKARLLRPAK